MKILVLVFKDIIMDLRHTPYKWNFWSVAMLFTLFVLIIATKFGLVGWIHDLAYYGGMIPAIIGTALYTVFCCCTMEGSNKEKGFTAILSLTLACWAIAAIPFLIGLVAAL